MLANSAVCAIADYGKAQDSVALERWGAVLDKAFIEAASGAWDADLTTELVRTWRIVASLGQDLKSETLVKLVFRWAQNPATANLRRRLNGSVRNPHRHDRGPRPAPETTVRQTGRCSGFLQPKETGEAIAQVPHLPHGGFASGGRRRVRAGNEHTGKHSLPGLLKILDELPA